MFIIRQAHLHWRAAQVSREGITYDGDGHQGFAELGCLNNRYSCAVCSESNTCECIFATHCLPSSVKRK